MAGDCRSPDRKECTALASALPGCLAGGARQRMGSQSFHGSNAPGNRHRRKIDQTQHALRGRKKSEGTRPADASRRRISPGCGRMVPTTRLALVFLPHKLPPPKPEKNLHALISIYEPFLRHPVEAVSVPARSVAHRHRLGRLRVHQVLLITHEASFACRCTPNWSLFLSENPGPKELEPETRTTRKRLPFLPMHIMGRMFLSEYHMRMTFRRARARLFFLLKMHHPTSFVGCGAVLMALLLAPLAALPAALTPAKGFQRPGLRRGRRRPELWTVRRSTRRSKRRRRWRRNGAGSRRNLSERLHSPEEQHPSADRCGRGDSRGPQNLNAYDQTEPYTLGGYQDGGHCFFHNSLIWGENLTNVSITGGGMINGGGLVRDGRDSR